MQHVLQHSSDWLDLPDWREASARRLNFSMILAALIVVALLSMMRLPTLDLLFPLMELVVDIVEVDAPESEVAPLPQARSEPVPIAVEPKTVPAPIPQTIEEALPTVAETPAESPAAPAAVVGPALDWEIEKIQAVMDAVDQMEKVVSVNPNFDRLRREAAIKFRASRAPVKKEIWDNVEKDQVGRTILRHGNFFRVLDDPSLTNRYAFETFEKYMVFFTYRKYVPKELPWVQKIRETHAYLRIQQDRRNGIFDTE